MTTIITIFIVLGSIFGNVSDDGDPTANGGETEQIIIFDDRQQ